MTSSFVPHRLAAETATLLGQMGVPAAAWQGGTLAARSPINGEAIGQVPETPPAGVAQDVSRAASSTIPARARTRFEIAMFFPPAHWSRFDGPALPVQSPRSNFTPCASGSVLP